MNTDNTRMCNPAWLEKASGTTFFGIPVHELNRDELLSAIGYLADQLEQERKRHRSTVDFIKAVKYRDTEQGL